MRTAMAAADAASKGAAPRALAPAPAAAGDGGGRQALLLYIGAGWDALVLAPLAQRHGYTRFVFVDALPEVQVRPLCWTTQGLHLHLALLVSSCGPPKKCAGWLPALPLHAALPARQQRLAQQPGRGQPAGGGAPAAGAHGVRGGRGGRARPAPAHVLVQRCCQRPAGLLLQHAGGRESPRGRDGL